jgi:hypothetical protein
MRRLFMLLAGGLTVVGLAFPAPAGASTTNPVTVTVGSPIILTARQVVKVPVGVVCDPLPGTPTADSVGVFVTQVSANSINSGSGGIPSSSPFLICDGTTVNQFVVYVTPQNTPFHGGAAIVTATASHETVENFFLVHSESGSAGPIAIKLQRK